MITKGTPKRSDTINVSDFLDKLKIYPIIIPNNYQREYTWAYKKRTKPSALEVFLRDFIEAYTKGSEYKLIFGNNVCIASNDAGDILHLSDGQQRTTTIFIFGLYLCNLIDNPEYRKTFFLVSTGNKEELRLQHSMEEWNKSFKNTLLNLDEEDDILVPIKTAFSQIDKFINEEYIDTNEDNKVLIKDIFDAEKFYIFLLYNVYVNIQYIPLEDEKQYFEDVNNKGVKLDSISSYKYELVGENEELLLLWQECVKQVDLLGTVFTNNSANSLLETVLGWACFIEGISKEISGANSISKVKNKSLEEKKKFLETMYNLSKIGYSSFSDNDFRLLRYINKGNYIIAFYLLHYVHNYSKQESINYLIFKYLTSDVGDKASSNGFYHSIKDNGIIPDTINTSIMDRFIYKNGANKNIRAILCIIESFFNKDILNKDISAKNYTLEHISSQQFEEEGFNSIGNLTLLTKSENSRLNKQQEKYPVYRDSEFYITKCLCSDYIPSNDNIRIFRSKYYSKGYSSQELDSFNLKDFKEREKNLLISLIKVLNLEKYIEVEYNV